MTELLVLLAVVLAVWGTAVRNGLLRQQALVEEAWRQVDVELQRRADLVPALVRAVQAGAAAPLAVPQGGDDPGERAEAESELSERLGELVAQAPPQVRVDPGFQQLLAALADTEDRVAAARRLYNGNVRALNSRVSTFPGSLVAQLCGVEPAEWFELDEPTRDRLELPPDVDP